MKLSQELNNFREYLESISAPFCEFCFKSSDLQEGETLRLILFGGVSCDASPLEYTRMSIEGIRTQGKATSEPSAIEQRAIRVSENMRPELMLLWSDVQGSFEQGSPVYTTLLIEKDGVTSKRVDQRLNSVRHLRYIISGR